MQNFFSAALSGAVSSHIRLSPTRQETLGWLVYLVMRQGTICLWRLAAHVATAAQTASVRRRFYRFFQFVRLDGAAGARMVAALLGLEGKPWVLAMDRTNWEFGQAAINILMISVMWKGVGIPLIWTLLPAAGNSDTATRTCLLDRLSQVFPDLKIAALTGDREFIGDDWMAYLKSQQIPFVLRLRENQHVVREGYETWTIADIAAPLARGEKMIVKGWCKLGAAGKSVAVRLVVMRLKTGELLSLAASAHPRRALAEYRRRWTIETLFANLKTKGFNLEDTHITDPGKLSTLIAVLAMAVALSVKTGVAAARITPIAIKNHGRKAVSLFALGLAVWRKLFAVVVSPHIPEQVIAAFRQCLSPKTTPKSLILRAL
jgi:hypothetical protein